jgi:hypothetical protein
MGLFSSDGGGETAADLPRRPSFNHAALAAADVDDARRGYPAVSLQPFAAANGLGYTTNELHSGFLQNLPKFPDYVFNVCHGAFPGGRLGLLQHELLELEIDQRGIRGGGTFHHVRTTYRNSAAGMLGLGDGPTADAPFTGNAAWLPITSVHLRTPELQQLPMFSIREGALLGGGKLDQHGLPGFRMERGPKDDAVLRAICAAVAPALSTRRDSYVRLQARYGVLSLTVNGYRADEQDLHHLAAAAAHIADSLTALTRRPAEGSFTVAGPAAASLATAEWYHKPHPEFVPAFAEVAGKFGMFHEHQSHLPLIAPRCPVPGAAGGVLFGTLPGTTTVGRLAWFELGGRFSSSVRAAVMVPATAGASTPLGGVYHAPTGMQVEVVDGIAYCWSLNLLTRRLGSAELTPAARTAFTATGVATI